MCLGIFSEQCTYYSILKMDEQEPLVFGATENNRFFEFPEVLDKNVDNIIVNDCDPVPTKPPDR